MDQFSIVGGGQDIEFALPAVTTVPDAFFGSSYRFAPVPGNVNGAVATVDTYFIFPGPCAVCDTIELTTQVSTTQQTLFIGLPMLYDLTFPDTKDVSLALLPGSYTAGTEYPQGGPTYTIDVGPAAMTAVTPEPPTLWLLATATVLSVAVLRRRPVFSRVAADHRYP